MHRPPVLRQTITTILTGAVCTLGLFAAAACSDSNDSGPAATEATSTAAPTSTVAPTTAAPTTVADTAPATVPADVELFTERGPFGVGVITISLGDRSTEVYYPIDAASVGDTPTDEFLTKSIFPENLAALVPPALNATFNVGAFRDVPAAEGSFPVVIYSHGYGGYRQIANSYLAHLASWGFVAASTDHLERGIASQLGGGAPSFDDTDLEDVKRTIAALRTENAKAGGLLEGRVKADSIGIAGHSAGSRTTLRAANTNDDIDVFVSISGALSFMGEAAQAVPAKPGLVIAANDDKVVTVDKSRSIYDALGSPRYWVNIANAGHNSFTDICPNVLEQGGLEQLRPFLGQFVDLAQDGCMAGVTDPGLVMRLLGHYTIAFMRTYLAATDTTKSLVTDITPALGEISLLGIEHA